PTLAPLAVCSHLSLHDALPILGIAHLLFPVGAEVRGAVELVERPETGVRDDRLEAVRVAGDPVRHVAAERAAHGRRPRPVEVRSDRKSTRLNSSHQIISYAVLC